MPGVTVSLKIDQIMDALDVSRSTAYRYARQPDSLPAPLRRLLAYEYGGVLPVPGWRYTDEKLIGPDGLWIKWQDLDYVDMQLARLHALERTAQALRDQLQEAHAELARVSAELDCLRSIA